MNEPNIDSFLVSAPKIITRAAYTMQATDEKVMSLYGCTAISSALLSKVSINYQNKIMYPQVYVVAVKPPGSGKGKLAKMSKLVEKINNELIQTNNALLKRYQIEIRIFESKLKKGVDLEGLTPPEKPKLKLLMLSGNTTSSMLIQQFDENDGQMSLLIFETEIDGLTNMMSNKKFGGDNSMVLRKAYHNEPITQMRKGNLESLTANSPKLAIFITGTPSQLNSLFKSNDDGLFSRFTLFTSHAADTWINVKPCEDCETVDDAFDRIAESYYALYHHMKDKQLEIKFTDEQWELLDKIGPAWHKIANEAGGENATSIAKRHVNMIVRFAANYTALRAYEEKNENEIIYCNDQDFINAQWLIEMSFFKALTIFNQLPGVKESNSNLEDVLDALPDSFKKRELAPLTKSMNVSERTMERYIDSLIENGKIRRARKGFYEKIGVSDLSNDASSN